ncbi:hypothetical protein [Streptomyces nymphaeiformis]|jgi:hypothetical protein|uniref:Uncharacterized protein n=1 Tax=Streptomyces nymphaeiformis TaxID=2663842 RepID=A0A7W7XBI1_9ACTN|nr:hypothetical protein [Streptomyces nymphaeiformis]MBB4982040.1 hypothetical protein [Streptomyces nymphaeiformis]
MSRTFLPGAADQAAWTVADAATRRLAEATVETLRTRETVERLARRYVDIGNAQRAGHLFEVRHALSFNQNAIRAGASVRAVVTEWAQGGSQTAAADLHLVDRGRLVGQAQAKLVDRVSTTAHQMARPDYEGMTRLVAGDRVAAVDGLLGRRLTMSPEGVGFTDYADAHAHLTDRLTYGDVASDPVDLADAHRSARDPMRWARGEAVRTAGREAVAAAGTAAAVGGLVTGAVSAAGQLARVRAGETSAAAAALTAAASAAQAAARSGAVAGLGSVIRTASRAGRLPAVLGGGDLSFATAGAAYAVAEAGVALARGQIDAGEFAARSAEATLRTGLGWACGAVAQTVIPVPVVGALVGGLVGQAAGALITQGLQASLVAIRGTDEPGAHLLERELLTASLTSGLLASAAAALGPTTRASSVVLPGLESVRNRLAGTDPTTALSALATLTSTEAGRPVFLTPEEFDAWMAAEDAPLLLDPNW